MSLNWKEIDRILQELDLGNCHIQQIYQKDFRTIYFQMFKPGRSSLVQLCLEQGQSRIHEARRRPGSKGKQPRFSEFLRARTRGGRILTARQLGRDRIILLKISRGEEITNLYIKLWGNAANILACDERDIILEAAYRRPARGETTGKQFALPDENKSMHDAPDMELRPHRRDTAFNIQIAEEYSRHEHQECRKRLLTELKRYHAMKESSHSSRLKRIKKAVEEGKSADILRHKGDLILSAAWKISPGAKAANIEDYKNDNLIVGMELDPKLSAADNARKYYADARKLESRMEHLSQERENVEMKLRESSSVLKELTDPEIDMSRLTELQIRMKEENNSGKGAKINQGIPGLEFSSGEYRILVGRTAKENDSLLRRHSRGNDTWVHTRDYPGGYVFIKNRPGKSIPLDVLLDAGNLALHFSKARKNGQADMYYTQVKHLRRPKQGKTGMVLPTQEKNLFVKADSNRLNRLLKGIAE